MKKLSKVTMGLLIAGSLAICNNIYADMNVTANSSAINNNYIKNSGITNNSNNINKTSMSADSHNLTVASLKMPIDNSGGRQGPSSNNNSNR
ncbi:MAG: hypothetical protein KBD37_06615 [Burkholderiales bacterium]|nr:hypothetical protein [Burkholderiales bacterium]